ncbi:DUF4011 domain-containing protein [Kocuria sp. M1R5S2]|uniref:DUF4011 domain-containing protein n=1 Tax=Kocuria rhizosphaerae TaxID=3376285 RepID=UPI00379046FB
MPETLPSEAIQRAAVAMARTLRPWVESHAPVAGDPQSWTTRAQHEDRVNGRPHRRYSMDDPRFLLRLLIQDRKQFDHQVTPLHSSWAREIVHHLNVCAHEPLTVTAAEVARATDTMRLLLESLGLHEPADVDVPAADPDANAPRNEPEDSAGAGPAAPACGVEPAEAHDGVPFERDDLPPGTRQARLTAGPLTVTVLFREAVNYALVNNDVSPLLEIRVHNTDPVAAHVLEELVLVLDDALDDGAMGTPRRVDRVTVGAGEELLLDGADVAWPLSHEAFAALDEARTVSLRINATVDGRVTTETTSVRLLARDEWYARSIPELLAAFITPNAAGVQQILERASGVLAERTGDPSLDGYQGGPERALEIGQAVYEALVSFGIRYAEPPASFETTGQKIRPVDAVLAERWGTCLDLTVACAAALEQAGLNPVVVRVPGHAFAGFLTEEAQLPELALTDPGIIQNFVRGGLLLPLETTAVVEGRALGFERARLATARHWDTDGEIHHVLDVAAAHRRIRPLPRVRRVEGGIVIEVEKAAPAPLPAPGRRAAGGTAASGTTAFPPRVRTWRSALLDLSLRNPLLKLKKTGAVSLVVPERTLPDLEDRLASGTVLRLRSGEDLSDIAAAQGKRSAAEMDDATLDAILRTEHTVHARTTDARHGTVLDGLRRKAKVVLEETGANNLFVTLGALSWQDKQGKEALAPLFLVPVVLTGRKNQEFRIQVEDGAEAQPNFCLIEKLKQDHGLEVPALSTPPVDESGMDVASVFEEVRRTMARHNLPFTVVPDVRLAMLQFSTLEMWRDLTTHWEDFLDNPVVRHLVETPTETFVDPVPEPEVDEHDEAASYLPVPTDGSQLKAVKWATAGRTFVLEGPPGTGKSQTITNMIADNLAAGRTVLFVAEKQAALQVVRDRLEKVGLGPLALELHGRQQSTKSVREQLVRSWDARTRTTSPAFGVLRDQHADSVSELCRYPRALHRPTRGRSVWQANQELLALRAARAEAAVPSGADITIPGTLVAQPERADAALRTAAALETSLPQLGHRPDDDEWCLAGPDRPDGPARGTAPLRPVGELLAALRELDDRAVALLRTTDDVGRWRTLAAWLHDVDAHRAMPPAHYREVVSRTWHDDLCRLLDDVRRVLAEHGPLLHAVYPAALAADLAPYRQELDEAQGKLFGRKKALAGVAQSLRRLAVAADEELLGDPAAFLDALDALQHAEQDLRHRAGTLLPTGIGWSLTDRDPVGVLHGVLAAAEALQHVLAAFPGREDALSSLLVPVGGAVPDRDRSRRPLAPSTAAFADAWTAALEFLGTTGASLHRWRRDEPVLDRLRQVAPVWQDQVDRERDRRLRTYRLVDAELQELEDAGFAALAGALRSGTASVAGLAERLRHAVAEEVLTDTLEESNLTSFDADARDRQVESYLELSDSVRQSMRTALPAQVLTATGINRERPTREQGEFNRLIHQKRGGSVREIMERTGSVLQQLTPCLLMSPHSVSKYLPAGAMSFDVVIFDEASQIRVADAIGAMGRSGAVVVVGDSQQMPPSSMFASSGADDEEGTEDEGLVVADQDSILTESVDSNVQSIGLTWHYRSQDESLIAFSNRRYYRGGLSSFPGPPERRPGLGVTWERVDGEFDGGQGGTRTNEVEAQRIVDDVAQRLREDPGASIGVVTFNTQQRDLVLDKLEQSTVRVVQDALVREDDPLFVKNLENVQGDERDVILFSLAFSRNKETGVLRLNFGPLTASGGQRRLNVAITRARRAITIYSSFGPEDIDLARTGSEGLRHLREYLIFARDHGRDAVHVPTGESWDLHRQDVAAELRKAGLEVAEDIGMSNFRVDLAARASGDHDWVGVLLDGPAWAHRTIVSDRDALPTQVLTGAMGWRHLERVWLPAWIRSRSAVVQEFVDATEAAVRRPAPESTPATEPDAVEPFPETVEPFPETEGGLVPKGDPAPVGVPAESGSGSSSDNDGELVRSGPPLPVPEPDTVTTRPPSNDGGNSSEVYRAAPHRETGSRADLDAIAAPRNKQLVRENLEEIIAAEGPVEARRLARLLGNRFGMQRVPAQRQETILGCLPRSRCSRSALGAFYWPDDVEPDAWTGFRRTPPGGDKRAVTEIAPQELGNAVRHFLGAQGRGQQEDVFQMLNEVFGFNRTGREIRERYSAVLDLLERHGRIVRRDGLLELPTA